MTSPRLFHLAPIDEWESGSYRPASLDDPAVGFVHCCTPDQVAGVIDRWFGGVSDRLVVLELDADRLTADVRWEDVHGIGTFPHLYGAIDEGAVLQVLPPSRAVDADF